MMWLGERENLVQRIVCQDDEMSIDRSEIRKKLREKCVRSRASELSRARDAKGTPDQEKVGS